MIKELKEEAKSKLSSRSYTEAIHIYKQILQELFKQKKQDYCEISIIYLNIGICHYSTHQFDQAIEMYFKSRQYNQKYTKCYYRLAQCYLKIENYSEAYSNIEILRKIQDNKEIADLYQNILMSWTQKTQGVVYQSVINGSRINENMFEYLQVLNQLEENLKYKTMNQFFDSLVEQKVGEDKFNEIVEILKHLICQSDFKIQYERLNVGGMLQRMIGKVWKEMESNGEVDQMIRDLLFIQQKVFRMNVFYDTIKVVYGLFTRCGRIDSKNVKIINTLMTQNIAQLENQNNVLVDVYQKNIEIFKLKNYDQDLFYGVLEMQNILQKYQKTDKGSDDYQKLTMILNELQKVAVNFEKIEKMAEQIDQLVKSETCWMQIVIHISQYLTLYRSRDEYKITDRLIGELREYMDNHQDILQQIDYLIALNNLMSKKQEIINFVDTSRLSKVLKQKPNFKLLKLIELFSYFDDYKFVILKEINRMIVYLDEIVKKPKLEIYCGFNIINQELRSILIIQINLLTDNHDESMKLVQKKYEMDQEQLDTYRVVQEYLQKKQQIENEIKYSLKFIKQQKVRQKLTKHLNQSSLINIIQNYQNNLDQNLVVVYLNYVNLLIVEKNYCLQFQYSNIIQFFIQNLKNSIQLLKKDKSKNIEEYKNLCCRIVIRVFANTNVELFRFQDLLEYATYVNKNLQFLSEQHPETIFEYQLSMVRILGYNLNLSNQIANQELIQFIQSNLLEQNQFLVSSSLEYLNNLLVGNDRLVSEFVEQKHSKMQEVLCIYYEGLYGEISKDRETNPYIQKKRQFQVLNQIMIQIAASPYIRSNIKVVQNNEEIKKRIKDKQILELISMFQTSLE